MERAGISHRQLPQEIIIEKRKVQADSRTEKTLSQREKERKILPSHLWQPLVGFDICGRRQAEGYVFRAC